MGAIIDIYIVIQANILNQLRRIKGVYAGRLAVRGFPAFSRSHRNTLKLTELSTRLAKVDRQQLI